MDGGRAEETARVERKPDPTPPMTRKERDKLQLQLRLARYVEEMKAKQR